MNISDIRTRIESGADEQSFLAAKTAEPEGTPVLTLRDRLLRPLGGIGRSREGWAAMGQ
jgi:hypothetical protein